MRPRQLSCALILALTLTLSFAARPVWADPFYSSLITVIAEGGASASVSSDDLGCVALGGGLMSCDGAGQTLSLEAGGVAVELFDWDISLNEDPFVSSNFGFLNTGATATFTIVSSIPIAPLAGTRIGGSSGGSVTDANFDGVGGLTTVAPDALYVGLIDGVPVLVSELHADPFSVGFSFNGETVNIPNVSFGLPGPTTIGPAVAASIGIRNRFELTGGDSVALTNFFVVELVPEPGTGLLLAFGLALLSRHRRRGTRAGVG